MLVSPWSALLKVAQGSRSPRVPSGEVTRYGRLNDDTVANCALRVAALSPKRAGPTSQVPVGPTLSRLRGTDLNGDLVVMRHPKKRLCKPDTNSCKPSKPCELTGRSFRSAMQAYQAAQGFWSAGGQQQSAGNCSAHDGLLTPHRRRLASTSPSTSFAELRRGVSQHRRVVNAFLDLASGRCCLRART